MKKLLLTLSAFLLMVSVASAAVTIANTKNVNSKWQFVAVTLTADGDSCRDVVSTPVLADMALQAYVDAQEPAYILHVLKAMYSNARYTTTEGQTELEAFQAWIQSGHTNTAYCKGKAESTQQACTEAGGTWTPEEVITKVPWVNSWDVKIVGAESDMKDSVFYKKTLSELNTYIDNNWTNLTDSKATFKKLVQEVRNIILRQGWESE